MTKARRDRLDAAIEEMAADSEFTPVAQRLGCLRGVSTLTGFGLAVEIGDWHRFSGSSIGSFVGLVPSEYSSGTSRTLGPITKTGNGHARRLLVEAAWHHRPRYRVGKVMRERWDLAPMRPGSVATRATGAFTTAGSGSSTAANALPSPTSPSPASWPAGAGHWPSSTKIEALLRASPAHGSVAARGVTRDQLYEQPPPRRQRSSLDTRNHSSRNTVLR